MWLARHIFQQFWQKARNANLLVEEPETDFYAKWLFKVICVSVTEEQLWDYILVHSII